MKYAAVEGEDFQQFYAFLVKVIVSGDVIVLPRLERLLFNGTWYLGLVWT